MIYLILLIIFLVPLFSHLSVKAARRYYWFECIAIILVMGFRYYVGGDTIGYMAKYEYVSPIYDLTVIDFVLGEYQPLWVVLQSTCKTVSEEFYVLQLVISTLVNITVFWMIQKYCNNKFLAALLYLLNQMLNFNTEILRAVLAICVFLVAYEQLVGRHYLKYYLLVVVAILFHDQAFLLIFVPLFYPLLHKPLSPIVQVCLFITGILLTMPQVMNLYVSFLPGKRGETFAEGYGSYQIASILGYIHVLVNICLLNIVIRSNAVLSNRRILPVLNLFLCCTIIGFGMPVFTTRVRQFFSVYYLCALSTFILYYKHRVIKTVVVVVWLFGVVKWYTLDVTNWVDSNKNASNRYYFYERFYPYYSIWEEPDQTVMTRRKEIADEKMLKIK